MIDSQAGSDSSDGSATGAAVDGNDDGWRGVVGDLFPRNPHGIIAVISGLVSQPFATIFRLSADREYRAYWSHIVVLTGITAIALYVTLPQIFNFLIGQDLVGVAETSQRVRLKMQVMQVAAFLLLTPLQYYVCRLISPVRREPRTYFKLCALSICCGLLLRIVLGILTLLAGLVIFHARVNVDLGTVIQIEFLVGTLLIVAFVIELHRRFWSLPLWKAVLLGLLFWLFTAFVVSPALYAAVQSFDLIDHVGRLKK